MTEPIIIQKSAIDEIRIQWREFKGHKYLDNQDVHQNGGQGGEATHQEGDHPGATLGRRAAPGAGDDG